MSIEKAKLYHFPGSRSARVKWMLHECIDNNFEVEIVELYQGEQYSETFRAKNPNHAVPVLDLTFSDGKQISLIESGAMVNLLANLYPQLGLIPNASEDPAARADYEQMMFFAASWFDMMLWQIRLHKDILEPEQQDPKVVERYFDKIATEVEPQLIARLTKHDYICGDSFTAVDCIMGHNVMWTKKYGLLDDPSIKAYLSRLSKRPAFLAAFADAKQFELIPPSDSELKKQVTG